MHLKRQSQGAVGPHRAVLHTHVSSTADLDSKPWSALQEYYLEGTFRNLHARLRTHAESIAFFGGGLREGSIVVQHFHSLLSHLHRVIDIRSATCLGSAASDT